MDSEGPVAATELVAPGKEEAEAVRGGKNESRKPWQSQSRY